jgi:hypothetical protein
MADDDKRDPDENDDEKDLKARKPKAEEKEDKAIEPNPPRTTKFGITAPKFGFSGSGGAELEPGPERD